MVIPAPTCTPVAPSLAPFTRNPAPGMPAGARTAAVSRSPRSWTQGGAARQVGGQFSAEPCAQSHGSEGGVHVIHVHAQAAGFRKAVHPAPVHGGIHQRLERGSVVLIQVQVIRAFIEGAVAAAAGAAVHGVHAGSGDSRGAVQGSVVPSAGEDDVVRPAARLENRLP